MYGLFNICAFAIVEALFLVGNKFLLNVIGFDIIQEYMYIHEYHPWQWSLTSRSDSIICKLDIDKNK
jgi:hypothetical protein